jgi:hypothetical protein
MPTLPGLIGEAVERHVSVAADERLFLNPGEPLIEPLDRAVDQHDLLVVPSGRVAEQDCAQPVDLEADSHWQRGEPVTLSAGQLLSCPDDAGLMGCAGRPVTAVEDLNHCALAVAPHPDHFLAEGIEQVECLGLQRSDSHVTGQHNRVGTRGVHVAQDRLQRG